MAERNEFSIKDAMTAQLWEEAKGKLRALVHVQGSYYSMTDDASFRWQDLEKRINAFIKDIEDDGLHEPS